MHATGRQSRYLHATGAEYDDYGERLSCTRYANHFTRCAIIHVREQPPVIGGSSWKRQSVAVKTTFLGGALACGTSGLLACLVNSYESYLASTSTTAHATLSTTNESISIPLNTPHAQFKYPGPITASFYIHSRSCYYSAF